MLEVMLGSLDCLNPDLGMLLSSRFSPFSSPHWLLSLLQVSSNLLKDNNTVYTTSYSGVSVCSLGDPMDMITEELTDSSFPSTEYKEEFWFSSLGPMLSHTNGQAK